MAAPELKLIPEEARGPEPSWNLWRYAKYQRVKAPWWSSRGSYVRRIPYHYREPTNRMREQRAQFIEAAMSVYGMKGKIGGRSPVVAALRRRFGLARYLKETMLLDILGELRERRPLVMAAVPASSPTGLPTPPES